MKKSLDFANPKVMTICALICCLLWGSAFPCIKIGYSMFHIAGNDTASVILFAGTRFFLAGMLAIAIGSTLQHRFLKPKKESIGMIIKLSCVQTILQYLFFYIGLAHTSGVKGSIINGTNVFVALLLSAWMFKEKLTPNKIIGCLLGFAGIVIINLNKGSFTFDFTFKGEGSIALSAVMYALSSCMIKKYSKHEDAFTLSGYQFFIGGIFMMVIGKALGGHIEGFNLQSSILLLYLAFISAFAYSLWSILLRENPVSKVTIFGFTNPMFGVILSAIFLHEKNQAFTMTGLVSLLLVCVGIIIVNKPSKKAVNA